MIVAERKPFEEIVESVGKYDSLIIAGCATCVTVCMAGGEKEVGLLASQLKMQAGVSGRELRIEEITLQRQCDEEYLEPLKKLDGRVVLSLGCGAGVQMLAEKLPGVKIIPGLNTRFIGVTESQGVWAERCAGCGNCLLERTGGICPVARCSKSLMNGPCGGSQNGKCEIGQDVDCAWQLIHDRLGSLQELDRLVEIMEPRDWSTHRDGGPRRVTREDLTI